MKWVARSQILARFIRIKLKVSQHEPWMLHLPPLSIDLCANSQVEVTTRPYEEGLIHG